MKQIDELLTYKTIAFKRSLTNSEFLEKAISESKDLQLSKITKNVCAHLPMPLVNRLEECLNLISLGKREFIQAAIIDALDRFDKVSEELKLEEAMEEAGLFVDQQSKSGTV